MGGAATEDEVAVRVHGQENTYYCLIRLAGRRLLVGKQRVG